MMQDPWAVIHAYRYACKNQRSSGENAPRAPWTGEVLHNWPLHTTVTRSCSKSVNDVSLVSGQRDFSVYGLPGADQRCPAAVQVLPADHLQEPRLQQPLPLPSGHAQIKVHWLPEGNSLKTFVFYGVLKETRRSDHHLYPGAYPGNAGRAAPRFHPTLPGDRPEGWSRGDGSGRRPLRFHRDPHCCSRCVSAAHSWYVFTRETFSWLNYVRQLSTVSYPGVRAETSTRMAGGPQGFESEGVQGLKALGVRELSYRLAFLACSVAPTNPRVRDFERFFSENSKPTFCTVTNVLSVEVWG